MADERIEIDDLPSTSVPTEQHRVPAMKDGLTISLTVEQILSFVKEKVRAFVGPNYIHEATSKAALDDADELGIADSAALWVLKKVSITNLIASIFKTTRTIANAQFAADTFRLFNAAGTPRSLKFNIDALSVGRTITVPDAGVDLGRVNNLLGYDQTWQDLKASRAVDTSYQNTTGRPIYVNVSLLASGAGRTLQASANGSTWVDVGSYYNGSNVSASGVVPIGWYYRISGTGTIVGWSELR